MKLGIDLDNTLICYDDSFRRVAIKQGHIDEQDQCFSKHEIKNLIIRRFGESYWTNLQGLVYGTYIMEAKAYRGAVNALNNLLDMGFYVGIYSHKTKYPYLGENVDLHEAANSWLYANFGTLMDYIELQFFEKKTEKIDAINSSGVRIFIDDLPDILEGIRDDICRIHFSPKGGASDSFDYVMCDWSELNQLLKKISFS